MTSYSSVANDSTNCANGIPNDVHIVRVDFDFECSLNDQIFDVLSPKERRRASKLLRHADAMRFALTRVALRQCVSAALGKNAAALEFADSSFCRPVLSGEEVPGHFDFNVSHSGNHGLVAWSTARRVGVDIEERNDRLPWCQLVDTVLGEADIQEWRTTPPPARGDLFFEIWVAKEALLKAHGTGITDSLKDFSVIPCCSSPTAIGHTALAETLRRFQGVWLRDIAGYAAFVAWSRQKFPTRIA